MASRAHVIHDYSLVGSSRPRRAVRFRTEDPVVLPRTGVLRSSGGLVATALTIGALVAGGVYSMSYRELPTLSETEAAPLADNYEPNPDFATANAINALSGPLYAARELAAPGGEVDFASDDLPPTPSLDSPAVIDDSAPGAQDSFPQTAPDQLQPAPAPNMTPATPYPNPTTTPPDAVAPETSTPSTPTPVLDPENPYR